MSPILPVAQKAHLRSHPTCVETQRVVRPYLLAGMSTDSILAPSSSSERNFRVPQGETVSSTGWMLNSLGFGVAERSLNRVFCDKEELGSSPSYSRGLMPFLISVQKIRALPEPSIVLVSWSKLIMTRLSLEVRCSFERADGKTFSLSAMVCELVVARGREARMGIFLDSRGRRKALCGTMRSRSSETGRMPPRA